MDNISKLIEYYNINDENDEKLDVNKILKALDNDRNEDIFHLSSSKMKQIKNKILQQLGLPGEELKKLHKKLEDYRYVNDLINLKEGTYIRWIPLKNVTEVKLTNGGILLEIKLLSDGIQLLCKNRLNRKFQIKMDEVLIFQKLTQQELILLKIIDELNK